MIFQSTCSKASPIKCLDLDDISGQVKLDGWQYNVLFLYTLFNEEAPVYWQFWGGGAILVVILVRRPHFIGYLREIQKQMNIHTRTLNPEVHVHS